MDMRRRYPVEGLNEISTTSTFASSTFMEFRRNDQETIQLMAKAAKIVPKVCDILGISLSDAESEAEDDNTAAANGERSPFLQSHQQDEPDTVDSSLTRTEGDDIDDDSIDDDADNQQVQVSRPKFKRIANRLANPNRISESALGSHVRKSRKRCASTPSTLSLGQPASSTFEGLRDIIPPTKRRRIPSISISSCPRPNLNGSAEANAAENNNSVSARNGLTAAEEDIRKKMMRDMELLQEQMTQLAEVEKEQVKLMRRYLEIECNIREQNGNNGGQGSGPVQVQLQPQSEDSVASNDAERDGTNYATTASIFEEAGIGNNGENNEDNVVLNAVEIFSDADIAVGAEEVVLASDNTTEG